MTSASQRLLIFLDMYRIYVYSAQMEQPYPIQLPTSAVRDIEILNRDQVYALVEAFLAQAGISGGNAVMVLAQGLLFEKQIVQDLSDETRRNAAIKEYIDNVPFEQSAYVTYPIQTGIGVVATNEEFFATVKRAFEKKNVTVNLIVPAQAFGDVKVSPQTGPDAQTAAYFLENMDQVKQFAFHVSLPPIVKKSTDIGPKLKITNGPSKKLPLYLSVFGFLILVLVIMLVMANQPPANKPVTTTAQAEEPAAAINQPSEIFKPQGGQAAPESTASAQFDHAAINVQIKTPALFRTKVDEIKGRMTAAGFTTVDVIEAPAADATVIYIDKSKITAIQRDALLGELRTYFADVTAQDVEQAQYAVQIVIGQSL